jgi:hypothetical protein
MKELLRELMTFNRGVCVCERALVCVLVFLCVCLCACVCVCLCACVCVCVCVTNDTVILFAYIIFTNCILCERQMKMRVPNKLTGRTTDWFRIVSCGGCSENLRCFCLPYLKYWLFQY